MESFGNSKVTPAKAYPNLNLTRLFIAADDVNKVLKDSGVKGDKKAIETMIKLLEGSGKSVPEMIADGYGKFAQMSVGGGGGGAATEAPAGDAPAAGGDKKEKEKPKEESEEMDLGGGLFGDDEY